MPQGSNLVKIFHCRRQRRRTFCVKIFNCWRTRTISHPHTTVSTDPPPPPTTLPTSTIIGWANLSPDILHSIIEHLPLPDRIRFASVCTSWLSISRTNTLLLSPPQPPWLLLIDELEPALTTAVFFSPSEKRLYKISQPDPPIFNRTWCGSSQGWLVTMDVRSGLLLLNPLTRCQIQLPPLATLPTLVRPYRMARVSWDPQRHYTVMLALLSAPYLAFTREGDDTWSSLQGTKRVADLAVHDGVFYTLDLDGTVGAWDLSGGSPVMIAVIVPALLPSKISYGYLVNSQSGLLQVWRARDEMDFRVFELDFERGEWVRVESLGDRALFLDLFSSMSVNSRELAGLGANCIYFTTGYLERPRREWGTRRFSLENRSVESIYPESHCWKTWVYRLDDRSVEPIAHPQSHWKQPPIWITPSFT